MFRDILCKKKNIYGCAVIEDGSKITYEEIIKKANAMGVIFEHTQKGSSVAIFLPNGGDFLSAFFGVIQIGLVAFPLNTQLKKSEIARLLHYADIKAVISSSSYHSILEEIQIEYGITTKIIDIDRLELEQWAQLKTVMVSQDDPMVLLCTSGTSQNPKLVQLSERNILTSAQGLIKKMHFTQSEQDSTKYFLATPFSSAYGIMIISMCFIMDFPLVISSDAFTLDCFFHAVERDKVTHYEGGGIVILMLEKMLGRSVGYDISSLKFFGFGGSPVSSKTIELVQNAYPDALFLQGYGMTESSPLITKIEHGANVKTGSVGTAIDGVTVCIKTAAGITKSPFIKGEVVVKGDNVMLGYYKNEIETNKVIIDGYLHTGDIGYLDENGYLFLCGRQKHIILVRGFTVYPEEVEKCILDSGLVHDCYVYGKTNAFGQEAVYADVIPFNGEERLQELLSYCKANLASYKQPQQFYFCSEIKKNVSGKTERKIT